MATDNELTDVQEAIVNRVKNTLSNADIASEKNGVFSIAASPVYDADYEFQHETNDPELLEANRRDEIDEEEIINIVQRMSVWTRDFKANNKWYQKYKLWLGMFIAMSIIALGLLVAVILTNTSASNPNISKSEAIISENIILSELVNGSNITEHLDAVRVAFNAFDDNDDGVWNVQELSEYLQTATYVGV